MNSQGWAVAGFVYSDLEAHTIRTRIAQCTCPILKVHWLEENGCSRACKYVSPYEADVEEARAACLTLMQGIAESYANDEIPKAELKPEKQKRLQALRGGQATAKAKAKPAKKRAAEQVARVSKRPAASATPQKVNKKPATATATATRVGHAAAAGGRHEARQGDDDEGLQGAEEAEEETQTTEDLEEDSGDPSLLPRVNRHIQHTTAWCTWSVACFSIRYLQYAVGNWAHVPPRYICICKELALSDDTFMSDPGVGFMGLGVMRFASSA
jgi:hypothetical protein